MANPYRYRMANILWKRWIGPGHMGTIHNEGFLLQRIERPVGFRWTLTRRKTGEVWEGSTIQGLVEQAYIDLHCEEFDVESIEQTDGPSEWCTSCAPDAMYQEEAPRG